MIYFLGNKEYLKIGFTDNPQERINNLIETSPFKLEVISIIEGAEEQEKYIQTLFKKYHIDREWFIRSTAIEDYIKTKINVYDYIDKKRNKKFFGFLKSIRLKEGYNLYSMGIELNISPTSIDRFERNFEKGNVELKMLNIYLTFLGYEFKIIKKDEAKKGL